MNSIHTMNQIYLRPSRTIEQTEVRNAEKRKRFYVYNYEGYSFRVFHSLIELKNFFDHGDESNIQFDTGHELDDFLKKVDLSAK